MLKEAPKQNHQNKMTRGGFHKELLVLSLGGLPPCPWDLPYIFNISYSTSPKLGLVITLCAIDPWAKFHRADKHKNLLGMKFLPR